MKKSLHRIARPPRSSRRGAFSLIELLVVISLIALLMVMAVPAVTQIAQSSRINLAAQNLMEEMTFARSIALAKNLPVEVCFFSSAAADGSGQTAFRSLRTGVLENDGTGSWASRERFLPAGVAIFSNEEFSNIVGAQTPQSLTNFPGKPDGVSLRIYPSGRVEFPGESTPAPGSAAPFFVTVGAARQAASAELPQNFATIQIDPRNAAVTFLRP